MREQSSAVRSSGCQRFEAGMYRRVAISLGHVDSALQTIYPQSHDIPMNLIVTDQSIYRGASTY